MLWWSNKRTTHVSSHWAVCSASHACTGFVAQRRTPQDAAPSSEYYDEKCRRDCIVNHSSTPLALMDTPYRCRHVSHRRRVTPLECVALLLALPAHVHLVSSLHNQMHELSHSSSIHIHTHIARTLVHMRMKSLLRHLVTAVHCLPVLLLVTLRALMSCEWRGTAPRSLVVLVVSGVRSSAMTISYHVKLTRVTLRMAKLDVRE